MTHWEPLVPARLFGALQPDGIVLVAVSGGSDSLALLLLANAWAQPRDITLHAVTIDHGLRPEAAAEAAYVAGLCETLGIDHTTLAWEGMKPSSALAERARRARYRLIEEFALEIGSDLVLTGHTADDQAETICMRLRRKAREQGFGRGLSGMAPVTRLPGGTLLARPLLAVGRERLRAHLASFPQSWIEDPSNCDAAYERVRVRQMLADAPALRHDLLRFGRVMGRYRAVLARDTARLLEHFASLHPGQVFGFNLEGALAAPRPVLVHALQVLVAASGGAEYLPPARRVEEAITELAIGSSRRATLGGAVIERIGHRLRLYREMRNLASTYVDPGETVLWDGRLEVTNRGATRLAIAPLTKDGLAAVERDRNGRVGTSPRAALHSSALISAPDGQAFLPMLEPATLPAEVRFRLAARALEHFCPETDFPLLDWLQSAGQGLARRTASGRLS